MNVKGILLIFVVQWSYETAWAYDIFDDLDQTIGPVYFSNILHRHAEREAVTNTPGILLSYPVNNAEGQKLITKVGMRHLYNVGSWLRKRYDHLIPKTGIFDPNLVSVTTSVEIEISMSVRCSMAGMFPPTDDEMWGPAGFVPVPIRTQNSYTDNLIQIPNSHCEKFVKEREIVQKTEEFKTFVGQYDWVFNASMRVYNSTFNITNPLELSHDIIASVPSDVPTIPESAEERAFLRNLKVPDMAYCKAFLFNDKLKRLTAGPLLKTMISDMVEAAAAHPLPTKRFSVYPGSQRTLAGLIFILDVQNAVNMLPIYGAALLFELRVSSNNTAYITLVYQNTLNLNDKPQILNSRLCPNPCRLDSLIEVTKHLLPDDWAQECNED